jgi:hypothetical protein
VRSVHRVTRGRVCRASGAAADELPLMFTHPTPHIQRTLRAAGNVAFADKVYARGLARGAAPADRLVARYREFKRRTYRKWRTHVAAAEAAGTPVAAGQPPRPVRAASLPERWSDDIDFHATVDLDALSRAAAAAGAPQAGGGSGGSSSENAPLPRAGGAGATADPLAAGMGALPPASSGGGAPRAALGTIAESSAARSYRQPAPQQTPAEFEASLPASTRNVLAGMAPPAPVAAATNFARGGQQPQPQRAALGGAASRGSGSGSSNSNVPIAVYSDFDDAPQPPVPQQVAPPVRAAAVGGAGGLSARPAAGFAAVPAAEPVQGGDDNSSSSSNAVDSVGVSRAVASSWRQLPTQADVRKENTQAPSKWTEAAPLPPSSGGGSGAVFPTVGARPAPSAARDSRVAVWVDDELAAPQPAAVAVAARASSAAASRPMAPPAPTAMRLRELELPPQAVAPVSVPARAAFAPPAPLDATAQRRAAAPAPAPVPAPGGVSAGVNRNGGSGGGSTGVHSPPAELAVFLGADMAADEEAWSCEERRAQAWMRKAAASASTIGALAAIAATTTASMAAQLASAPDRTARLSAVHELLGSMVMGGSGDDATNASSDDIDVVCSDDDDEEHERAPPVASAAQPAAVVPPAGGISTASAGGGGGGFVPYEDSFLAQPPSPPPTAAASRQAPGVATARAPAALRPLPAAAVAAPPPTRQPAQSPTTTLFSADISGIVAAEDSIQPGAMQFYALAAGRTGGGALAPQPPPSAAAAWRPHLPPPHQQQQQQLSTIMEAPSALSHSTSAASGASGHSHASVTGAGVAAGGGGFQVFVDESLAEANAPHPAVVAAVRPALAARAVPPADAENRPARAAAAAPLPPSKVAAMLFEPAPRMPHKPAVAVAAKPVLAPAPPPVAAAALVTADEDDVTINTRLAMSDMDDLFASPSLKRAQAARAASAAAAPAPRLQAPVAPIHQSLAAAAVVRQPAAPLHAARPQPVVPAALQPYVDSPPPVDPPPRRAGGRGNARAMSMGGFDLSRIPPDARRLSMAIGVARAPSQSAPVARADSPLRSPPKSPLRVSSASGPSADRTADTGDIANLLGEQPGVAEQPEVDENAPMPGYSNARPAQRPATFRAIDPYSVTPLAPGEQPFVTVADAGDAGDIGRGYAPAARGAERFTLYQDRQFAGNGAHLDSDGARF